MGKLTKIRKILGAFVNAPDRFDELAARIARTDRRVDEINRVDPAGTEWVKERLCRDSEGLRTLNRELSVHRTVWGPPERLVVSPTAAVESCLFNVNSGTITIGEYTFAGSGVSILAGSHDPELRGYLRRDAELTEGCDITVGKGVWLASGCMLLGPCEIGDNAVIAAGAVVVPETKVPAEEIWGGVPARQIGTLAGRPEDPAEDPAVLRALGRENGILCMKGWSEKKIIPGRAENRRWMEKDEAEILVSQSSVTMEYGLEGAEKCTLTFRGSCGETCLDLKGEGAIRLSLPVGNASSGPSKPETVAIRKSPPETGFWARFIPAE